MESQRNESTLHRIMSLESEAIAYCWDSSCGETQRSLLVVHCPDREHHSLLLPLPLAIRGLTPPTQALTSDTPLLTRFFGSFTYFCLRWNVRAPKAHLGLFVWFRFGLGLVLLALDCTFCFN